MQFIAESKTHHSSLADPHFELVLNGTKSYELRVNDEKRQKMMEQDFWIFTHKEHPDAKVIRTKITKIIRYESFKDAIFAIGAKKLLPHDPNISDAEAVTVYENLDNGNYKKDADLYGVVVFELQLLDKN